MITCNIDELKNEILKNPSEGLHKFYLSYGKFIKTTAMIICKDFILVEEIINSVLIVVWKTIIKGHIIRNFNGWLYKVTRNCSLNCIKRHKKLELYDNVGIFDNNFEKIIEEDSFYNSIKDLTEYEQHILTMKFVQQFTFVEISHILKCPQSSVSSTYYRALDKLKNLYK